MNKLASRVPHTTPSNTDKTLNAYLAKFVERCRNAGPNCPGQFLSSLQSINNNSDPSLKVALLVPSLTQWKDFWSRWLPAPEKVILNIIMSMPGDTPIRPLPPLPLNPKFKELSSEQLQELYGSEMVALIAVRNMLKDNVLKDNEGIEAFLSGLEESLRDMKEEMITRDRNLGRETEYRRGAPTSGKGGDGAKIDGAGAVDPRDKTVRDILREMDSGGSDSCAHFFSKGDLEHVVVYPC